jgi:hypothetical protein
MAKAEIIGSISFCGRGTTGVDGSTGWSLTCVLTEGTAEGEGAETDCTEVDSCIMTSYTRGKWGYYRKRIRSWQTVGIFFFSVIAVAERDVHDIDLHGETQKEEFSVPLCGLRRHG